MDVEVPSQALPLDSVNGDKPFRKNNDNNFDMRGRRRRDDFHNKSYRNPPPDFNPTINMPFPPFPMNAAATPHRPHGFAPNSFPPPQFLSPRINIPPNGRGLGFRSPFPRPIMPFPGFLPNFRDYDPSRLPDLSVVFGPPPPMSVPYMEEIGELNLSNRILKQIEYYFSDENLERDFYLKRNMDEEGWVSIELIAGFNRIKYMTRDVSLILEALQDSDVVEINGEKIRRVGNWRKWILQEPQSSSPS